MTEPGAEPKGGFARPPKLPTSSVGVESARLLAPEWLSPLLGRLHSLRDTEQSLPHGVSKDEVDGLIGDLEAISASVMDLSVAAHPSFTDKCWMKEVREVCYDTEDYLAMAQHGSAGVCKFPWIQTKRRHGPRIAKDLSELRSRLLDVNERRKTFLPASSNTSIVKPTLPMPRGPLLQTPYADLADPMKHLVRLLALDDNTQQQLKVVPICGFAGVGKTALATRVYEQYGDRFQCRAFLRVSRRPDTRRLLASLLSQIKGQQPLQGLGDLQDLTNSIRIHLQDKSYLIVVDDIWATTVWDMIRHAFPEGSSWSRIITTTQIDDVALSCCSYQSNDIFEMGPLNDDESRHLLHRTVFGSIYDFLDQEFIEVSDGVVRKCGGIPLAIISVASTLANWQNLVMEQRTYIQDSLSATLRTNPTSEGMKEVLNFIYNNLPAHLKTCLLYFNMYPEDCVIRKDDLVNQWAAEGFLSAVEGQDIEKVAGSFFQELVATGMIQALDTDYNDEILSCTVHDMVLDLIAHECMEENFITVVDYSATVTGLADKVRRLSIKLGGAKTAQIPASFRMSQVRSLVFSGFFKCVPSIVECRLLRVLVLHIWTHQGKAKLDLAIIRELFQLRYLKIKCNLYVKLPAKIRGLQELGTMEVDARVAAVPSDIVHLQCLLHLRLPSEVDLPNRIGHMTSLRSLGYFNLSTSSGHNVLDLGKLTNVQDLHLTGSPAQSNCLVGNMGRFASILGKLSNLRSLILEGGASLSESIPYDGLSSVSPAPALLQRLELSPRICIISSLPMWISKLNELRVLKIALQAMSSDDVDILKVLPALAALSLHLRTTPAERIVFNDGFRALKYFKFNCTAPCVAFTEGAMLTVRRFKLRFSANTVERRSPLDAGFKHLTGLEVFSAKILGAGADESDRKAVMSALEDAFREHPSPPIINIQLVDRVFHREKEISTATQEVRHLNVHKDSTEGAKKPADSRTILPLGSWHMKDPESSSHVQKPGEDLETRAQKENYRKRKELDASVEKDKQHERQGPDSGQYSSKQIHARTSVASEISLDMQNPVEDKKKRTQVTMKNDSDEQHRTQAKVPEQDTVKQADSWTSTASKSTLRIQNSESDEVHGIQGNDSGEDTSKQADSWTSMAPESSLGTQNPDLGMGTQQEDHQTADTEDDIVEAQQEEHQAAERALPFASDADSGLPQTQAPLPPPPTESDAHRRSPARGRHHSRRRGCWSILLGPLLSLARWTKAAANSNGCDGLLWWRDLARCDAGHVSVAVVQANRLLEDQCRLESAPLLGTMVGVFDGHGGPEAARFACDHLLSNLQKASSGQRGGVTTDAIRDAFLATEKGFLEHVSRLWEANPSLATVGTCCLVGVVHCRTLFIANLGTSRAVLGRCFKKGIAAGKVLPLQLSCEHNAAFQEVREELRAQHPDDPTIVTLKHNVWRVKGLIQVSRSIGDAYLKHEQYNSERIHSWFRLREPFSKPILSANPSIISHDLQPGDRFVIFASDGLWEHLSNQEAVEIVHNSSRAGSARRLIKAALQQAALKHDLLYSDLKKIDKGIRRHFYDDITVVVLYIKDDLSVKDAAEVQPLSIRHPPALPY